MARGAGALAGHQSVANPPDMSYPVRNPGYRDDDPDLLLAIALSKSLMARPRLERASRLSTNHSTGCCRRSMLCTTRTSLSPLSQPRRTSSPTMNRMSTTSAHWLCACLPTHASSALEHFVPRAQDFLQGMVGALMSGNTDELPANLHILAELLEVCLAGTLGTEQWVFLAHVVDAAIAALFRLPNGMQELRLRSGIFIELCLRALEHIASDPTVDLRVRRLLGIDLAGWGVAWAGPGAGWARCGASVGQ